MAFVTIRVKGTEGYTRAPLGKDRCVVGRASAAEVSIPHSSVSREHCVIVRDGEAWRVDDLGSANGTWVGKDRVQGSAPLAERSIIKCGKARLTFHLGEMPAAATKDEDEGLDLDLGEPGDDGAAGEARLPGDPLLAVRCAGCGMWLSTAHRTSSESWPCPRCGRRQGD
ncbi:MAG: hypothetical protein RLZZ127_1596 [Planctomycetota bacterium]